ncbi:acyl-CoA dehydrogenase family protein [Qipengyuania sp.]|uniref:acyl-CoA dehydrogenase family protein n=1 Tax=Qipengyuania sp. TaxID=2004515 RepID=UPI003735BF20
MTMLDTPEALAFRQEVREFLATSLPDDLRRAARRATSVFQDPSVSLAWQKVLHARGWAAPDWPAEHGGPGWDDVQRYIYAEESARANAPTLAPMGLKMVAPVIMHYGTPAQKAELLPRILSGEDYWCQGYSEPGAGSDLASLKLRAVRNGDDYVLNGSKIWTTHAHFANKMFCLVRTSTDGRPQSGITFLLLDMDTPGITVTPIHTLAGDHEFNQVFFDDVRVPVAGRLGDENAGWTVAKHLLTFERGGRYAPALAAHLAAIREGAEATGWIEQDSNRERLAAAAIGIESLRAIELAGLAGRGPGAAVRPSMLKVLGTEIGQQLDTLALDIAAGWEGAFEDAPDALAVAMPRYLNNRASMIYAGSNEIQRDLIARVVVDQAAA